MGKSLRTLIRLRKFEVDGLRRVLGELLGKEEELKAGLVRLEEEFRQEQAFASGNVEFSFAYGAYVERYKERRAAYLRALQIMAAEIAKAQENLAEGYRVLKTTEITEANRVRREREEEARKEQIALDEIAQNLHRRRDGE